VIPYLCNPLKKGLEREYELADFIGPIPAITPGISVGE